MSSVTPTSTLPLDAPTLDAPTVDAPTLDAPTLDAPTNVRELFMQQRHTKRRRSMCEQQKMLRSKNRLLI